VIAALFVETNGVYFNDSRFEPWDEKRDARAYQGPHPVIAHPPCQLWGKFAKINFARWGGEHNRPGNDGGCFKAAIDAVRRFCGVLEHPAFSYAWSEFGLVRPKGHGWSRVGANEYVCEVWQSAYGHPARKRTWLFYVGKRPHELRWDRPEGTHQIGFHDQRGKERNKPTVRGKAASATPEAFAHELYLLAKNSNDVDGELQREPRKGE